MGGSASSSGSGTLTKLALITLVGLSVMIGIGVAVMGSEDPPDTSCLPNVAAAPAAASTPSGAMGAAADEAVAAGRSQGIDVAVAISDSANPADSLIAGAAGAMPSASVIKLAVALAAGARVDAGALRMEQVKPLLDPMISVSDNDATNRLVTLLGGRDVVNSAVRELGVPAPEATLGRELGVPVSGADPNMVSIGGVSKLLQIIYDSAHNVGAGRKISKASANPIVAAMRNQQVNTKFGAVAPHDQIAHKTGELAGTSHDVGWFFAGQRWLAVSILTTSRGSDQAAGNAIIKRFATQVFEVRDQPVKGAAATRAPPPSTSAPSQESGDKTMPLREGNYQLESRFGPRGGRQHQGQDLSAPLGTPIYAAVGGTVAKAGPADGFGNWIIIDFDGGRKSNVYGHMRGADIKVAASDQVKAGQQIAAVGSEGESTGPHLHFELWEGGTRLGGGHAVDPMPWLRGAAQPSGSSANIRNVAAVTPGQGCGDVAVGGSQLKAGSVPPAFEPWIIKAGKTCPEVTAPIVAAQLENEAGFRTDLVSPSGAEGPSQFMPGTWAAKAVDGDGDGRKDPRSIPDAVMSQAAYDCELAGIMRDALKQGRVQGDLLELTLSAYNCGPGGTLAAKGPCQNAETQAYIKKIPERARTKFTSIGVVTGIPAGPVGQRTVAAAMRWLGTSYAWGGGTPRGPSKGITDGGVADSHGDFNKVGFDCSGLVLYAVYQATGGRIELGHYTVTQLNDPRGKPVPLDQLQPGDIVFPPGSSPNTSRSMSATAAWSKHRNQGTWSRCHRSRTSETGSAQGDSQHEQHTHPGPRRRDGRPCRRAGGRTRRLRHQR
ncbi:peptidoglycan DD-metalloendopeptidase family protein [Gordonia sp. SID5947]|uniref:peptidoglycan DD-metalloendopeptidase family protein n=1 Tax=Gordonia sp. SID5947 TaxID=2690315 RepID=UPI0031BB2761